MAKVSSTSFQRYVWWTAALLLALAATLAFYLHLDTLVEKTSQVRLQSILLADEMRQSSDELTRMARNYVATGSPEYLQRYQSVLDIREGRKPRSVKFLTRAMRRSEAPGDLQGDVAVPLLELMRRTGIEPKEFELLAQAKASSDTLALTEFAAMGVVEKNGSNATALTKARAMLYDQEYQSAKSEIMVAIDSFYQAVDDRTTNDLARADRQAQVARLVLIILGAGLVVVLARANRLLKHTLGGAVETIHAHITQLGQGDFSQVIAVQPHDTQSVLARLAQTQQNLRSIHDAQKHANDARESAMREAKTLMQAIDEHAIVSITDPAGTITYANEMFSRISGYSNEELVGQNHRIVKSSMQDSAYWIKVWKTISSGYVWRDVICNRAKDGSLYWVDTVIAPFFSEQGIEKYISIRTDLTAIKQVQQALESERSRLANLIAGTRAGTWELNLQTGESTVNARWAEMLGYTLEEVQPEPHRKWLESMHPQDLEVGRALLRQHIHGELEILDYENRVRHKDGHWVWQRTTGKLISRTADGRPQWLYGMNLDISTQKAAEAEFKETTRKLEDSATFLARAGRVAGIGRWQLDLEAWTMEWSEQTCHIMDMPPGYQPGFEEMMMFVAPEWRDQMRSAFAVASETGKPWDVEIQLVTAMGRRVWVRSAAEAEYANGQRTRLVGIFQDVSQRRKLEDEIRNKNDLMRNVLDHIPVGLSVMDARLNLVEHNQLFCTLLDLPDSLFARETVSFESIIRFNALRGEYGEGDTETIVKGILAKAKLGLAHQFQRSRGDGRTIEVRGAPMPGGGFVTTYADITELKRAMDAAQEASRSKSQFVANMSHEIRTPMNAILGLLKLIQNTELTGRQYDYVSKTEGAAKSLLGLLNDILDFSKMEAGKMELDPQPFRMDKVMRDLSVILAANVGTKPLEVLFDIDPNIPRHLIGDSLRLHQVLINLAGNAIKFTAKGEVIVKIAVDSVSEQVVRLHFSVSDTGIGIAADKLAHVFDDFSQAEGSTSRKYGGTGLGLSISRKLVQLMGGELRVTSSIGKGSTFFFSIALPLIKPNVDGETPLGAALAHLNVLIVDDNPVALDLLAHMAVNWGWNVETAASGERAIEITQSRIAAAGPDADSSPFDVVLMDWHMPAGLDGWETLHALRSAMGTRNQPHYIMVTAHGRENLGSRSAQEQACLSGFLVKPVTSSMLLDAVADARGGRRNIRARSRGSAASSRRLDGMHILLVEDNLINQQVARELLESEGARVEIAGNGKLGVQAVERSMEAQSFDVVLMDLQMPEMDGFTATRVIREELGLMDLPVIAMTANAMASDKDACIAAGMNDHVGKPFDLGHLVQVLLTRTHRFPRSGAPTNPATEAHSGDATRATAATAAHVDVTQPARAVDIDAALARLGGNTALYGTITQSYLQEAADFADQLDRLLGADDLPSAARLLHTIKGLSATVGAVGMASVARSAEDKVKGVAPFSALDLRRDFRAAVQTTVQALTEACQTIVPTPSETPSLANAAAGTLAPNPSQTLAQLQQLLELLKHSDMEALQVHARITSAKTMETETIAGLSQAIGRFDFEAATKHCEALIANLTASGAATP